MSNIIEQLGGYEKAKNFLNESNGKDWNGVFYMPKLKQSLLEYRRQHKIYEVGDSIIVNDDASSVMVYVIEKNHDNEYFKIRSKDGFRYCRIWRIERHATDAEIAAGKRL